MRTTYFYSHAPRGARPVAMLLIYSDIKISTHTPLAGRDEFLQPVRQDLYDFYSHAPRGARQYAGSKLDFDQSFLLTRPSRGATRTRGGNLRISEFLLTRPSRGATKGIRFNHWHLVDFYSHAPRGARHFRSPLDTQNAHFYSHAPRGARLYYL